METLKKWFQDWSDACEYANECAPDLSFLALSEPYTGLLWIAASCYFLWAMNEWRIKTFHQTHHFQQRQETLKLRLKRALAVLRAANWKEKKLTA